MPRTPNFQGDGNDNAAEWEAKDLKREYEYDWRARARRERRF
jgi:hypothetical protein